jgi:hypothetical protein
MISEIDYGDSIELITHSTLIAKINELIRAQNAMELGTTPNKQSVQCQHSFYAVRCAGIVRCTKCGAEFPLISTC